MSLIPLFEGLDLPTKVGPLQVHSSYCGYMLCLLSPMTHMVIWARAGVEPRLAVCKFQQLSHGCS